MSDEVVVKIKEEDKEFERRFDELIQSGDVDAMTDDEIINRLDAILTEPTQTEAKQVEAPSVETPKEITIKRTQWSVVKTIGNYTFSIIILGILVFLSIVLISGTVWVGEKILLWLILLSILTMGACIAILVPLSLFHSTRRWGGFGLYIASWVFGITGWFMGLLLTWELWGGFAVFIGLAIFGVGVVLIAMIATLLNGMWAQLGLLILSIILTYGLRILGLYLLDKHEG